MEAEVEGSAIVAMTPGINGAAAALSFEAGLGNNEAFSAGLESMDGGCTEQTNKQVGVGGDCDT